MTDLSKKSSKVLVADSAFMDAASSSEFELLNVFPMFKGDGAFRSTLDQLVERSRYQSEFYSKVMPKLIQIFKKRNPDLGDQNYNLVRLVLVHITTFYCDRALRVFTRLRQNNPNDLLCLKVESPLPFPTLSDMTQTWQLNQFLIQIISSKLGIGMIEFPSNFKYPEYLHDYQQKNLLFRPQMNNQLLSVIVKILGRFFVIVRSFSRKNAPFQSIGLHDDYYFTKKGFYGPFGFFRKPVKLDFNPGKKNDNLRKSITDDIFRIARDDFSFILGKTIKNLPERELNALTEGFIEAFVDWFPTGYLEGSSENLNRALDLLKPHNTLKAVLGNDTTSKSGHFICAASQRLNKPSISFQHGGHYGYIEDMAYCGQLEFPLCDKFISWGWDRLEEHFEPCEIIKLPSPKLSEKTLQGDYYSPTTYNRNDILFYSNIFHRFPHCSMSAHSRVDFIDEIFESLKRFFQEVKLSNLIVDHKPYNMRFVDLYKNFFKELESIGGKNYRLITTTHKGLSKDLIRTCKLIAFDQIGSGTLDCFTSGVPTMIYYKRIYSKEVSWAGDLYRDLENVGVVHRTPESFVKEVKKFLASPIEWMESPNRKKAISNFCVEYARASNNWPKEWKEFLRSFRQERKN